MKMTKEEREREQRWIAQEDARIMAQYEEIMRDKARLKRATKEAQTQANDLQKRANAMKSVAKKRGAK